MPGVAIDKIRGDFLTDCKGEAMVARGKVSQMLKPLPETTPDPPKNNGLFFVAPLGKYLHFPNGAKKSANSLYTRNCP